MKVHNVFHVSLLKPYRRPSIAGQQALSRESVDIDDDNEIYYEIANILNSRINPKTKKLEYLIEWKGYEGTDEETSWEPAENVESGNTEKTDEFHLRYPDKPTILDEVQRRTPTRRSQRRH